MSDEKLFSSGIPLEKGRKNRRWEDAVASQFPELFGKMSKRMKILVALAVSAGVSLLYFGVRQGIRYYRQRQLEKLAVRHHNRSTRLEKFLMEGRSWNGDPQVEECRIGLALIAEGHPNSAYGIKAAMELAKGYVEEASRLFADRCAKDEALAKAGKLPNRMGVLPKDMAALDLPEWIRVAFEIIPHSAEEVAYQEALGWYKFARSHAKDPYLKEYLTIRIARIVLALGQLKEAEKELRSVKENPLIRLEAELALGKLMILRGQKAEALAYFQSVLTALDYLVRGASDQDQGEKVYFALMKLKAEADFYVELMQNHISLSAEDGTEVVPSSSKEGSSAAKPDKTKSVGGGS